MNQNLKKLPCLHEWVHLRDEGNEEAGYRKWNKVDTFYCKRCLEQQRISVPVEDKPRYNY